MQTETDPLPICKTHAIFDRTQTRPDHKLQLPSKETNGASESQKESAQSIHLDGA